MSRRGQGIGDLAQSYSNTVFSSVACDLSCPDAAQQLNLRQGPSFSCVYHLAGIVGDTPVEASTWSAAAEVLQAKAMSAEHLWAQCAQHCERIVFFGSMTAWVGHLGQGVYGAANAHLQGFAECLRQAGHNAACVHFGPWTHGMAARLHASAQAQLAAAQLIPFTPQEGLSVLRQAQALPDPTVSLVAKANWPAFLARRQAAQQAAPSALLLQRLAGPHGRATTHDSPTVAARTCGGHAWPQH